MNKNELQVLIDYTKGMIADNKNPEKKVIIALCDELERVNNLEPVVYASEKDIQDLKIFTYLFAEKQSYEPVNIPLYRLD
ncbi:MAG: hypothetical protein ACTH5W_19535 [Providencia sp.]|uniref:hypothetical protein n=1 Tax=Providencia sp. TaxID=589 RepID=UPI003F994058